MATLINPVASSATDSSGSTASSSGSLAAPNEEIFLQLLVSQLQNQDPLNPADSTEFVSELAQFSQLEQVMAIRTDIESYHNAATATDTSGAGASQDSGSTGQSNTSATTEV